MVNNMSEIFFILKIIHILLLIIFLIIDAIVLHCARNEEDINNDYFRLHKKWGFLKMEFLKLLGAGAIIYKLTHVTIQSGVLMSIILAYCIFVFKFVLDYISFRRKRS